METASARTLSIISHLARVAFVLIVAAGATGQVGSQGARQILTLTDDIGRDVKTDILIA